MNQFKSSKKFLGMIKKPIKDLLPINLLTPFLSIFLVDQSCDPGYITEDDMKLMVSSTENVIDTGSEWNLETFIAGFFNHQDVLSLTINFISSSVM